MSSFFVILLCATICTGRDHELSRVVENELSKGTNCKFSYRSLLISQQKAEIRQFFISLNQENSPMERFMLDSMKNMFTLKHDTWTQGQDRDLDMDEVFY